MVGSQHDVRAGFVRAAGTELHDGAGRPFLLRGVGLGNWLLPEGYMWKFEPPAPLSPRAIEAFFVELVGEERAARFWDGFQRRFITDDDLARIAAEGFNHVRLALNSRIVMDDDGELIEAGLSIVDWLIDRCREHNLWVVLDLHGAPGGQTGTNIDDSPNNLPELFTERRYQEQTIALWRALARRYRDETVVAGYDLLNEPLPNDYQYRYADVLVSLYLELTEAIREEDPNHLIIYEGTHWSTNWDIFTKVWDANSMLQLHRYWAPPDRADIQAYLDTRDRLGLPIYMGEGGENNPDWIQTAFQRFEDHNISWNFWPWKKIETLTSPYSVVAPQGWQDIIGYAEGTAPRPTPDFAWAVLSELLDSFDCARCVYRPEVVNAMLRRAPLSLPASGFSFRGAGVSYQTAGATPLPGFRADEQVTILHTGDSPLEFPHNGGRPRPDDDQLLVSLVAGDWVAYDVHLGAPGRVRVRVDLTSGGPVSVQVNDSPVDVGGTGPSGEVLPVGRHVVRVTAVNDAVILRLTVEPVN